MTDKVEARRKHLETQLGAGVADRISRVDYIRILRAERDGRTVCITETDGGRMRITSSPPELAAGVTYRETKEGTMSFVLSAKPRANGALKPRPVVLPPGHYSLRFLQFLFSRRTYDRLFAQIAADEREEHADALSKGETRKAEWIAARVNLLLLWSAAVWAVSVAGKHVWSIWKLGN